MAFRGWKWLLLLDRQNSFAKAWRSRRGGWKRCCHWSAGKSLDPEVKAFLEENTEVTNSGHLTPEIRLRLLTPRCRFWREKPDLWPYGDPFWAIYWPGGQALSRYAAQCTIIDKPALLQAAMSDLALLVVILRDVYLPIETDGSVDVRLVWYILDNPRVVKGRSVLDLGSGCGATAIAAVMSGASQVLANDIDPIAGVAMILNCELNHLNPFPITIKNMINSEAGNWDLIVLGDMFYDEQLADGLHHWLRKCIRIQRTEVLIGDPGRHQFLSHSIHSQLHKVIEYSLPEYTRQENYGLTSSIVWSYQPSNGSEDC
ncbi:Electron transfer flavoprotein beta subunit lysine methyltransferase [Pitangus sulphuratus]|nr:Electron transfer flavoprotein beta subunit lysine methyltransferase [Pitangus sulphuratus]